MCVQDFSRYYIGYRQKIDSLKQTLNHTNQKRKKKQNKKQNQKSNHISFGLFVDNGKLYKVSTLTTIQENNKTQFFDKKNFFFLLYPYQQANKTFIYFEIQYTLLQQCLEHIETDIDAKTKQKKFKDSSSVCVCVFRLSADVYQCVFEVDHAAKIWIQIGEKKISSQQCTQYSITQYHHHHYQSTIR